MAAPFLRREAGGRYRLELPRAAVDLVEKRAKLVGKLLGAELVSADQVAPA